MQTDIDPRNLIGRKAFDRNGTKLGTIDEVYLDDATGAPEWAAIRTGLFSRDAFVPLEPSELIEGTLHVPFDRALIKDAPDFGVGRHLSPEQELQLYHHYGLDVAAPPPSRTTTSASWQAQTSPDPAPADGAQPPQGPPAPDNDSRTGGAGGNPNPAEGRVPPTHPHHKARPHPHHIPLKPPQKAHAPTATAPAYPTPDHQPETSAPAPAPNQASRTAQSPARPHSPAPNRARTRRA